MTYWTKLNSPGNSDGFMRVFMDDRLLMGLENISQRKGSSIPWNMLWIGGNYSNQGPQPSNGNRYIDDIRWYTSKP